MSKIRSWTLTHKYGKPYIVEGLDEDRGPIKVIELNPLLDMLEGCAAGSVSVFYGREITEFLREHGRFLVEGDKT